ncbi:MAG: TIGR02281 family clan AA aspartic protease [Novosphingobium sp.]
MASVNRLMFIAISAIASMIMIAQFLAPRTAPAASASQAAIGSSDTGKGAMFAESEVNATEIQIPRDSSGQFHVKARVNGSEERFLVDTGADVVALTVSSAEAAGLPVDPTAFQPLMRTASGEGHGAMFKVDDLEVAGRHFRDADVVVMEGLETNLLGQSVLRKLGRIELKGDRMVIARD